MNQEEIDACIVQADELIKNDQIEEAIEVLEQAKSAANEIDWQERVVQITRMIEDIQKIKKRKRGMKKNENARKTIFGRNKKNKLNLNKRVYESIKRKVWKNSKKWMP